MCYFYDNQVIKKNNVYYTFIRLVNLGLFQKVNLYYTLTPSGWQHYNNLISLYNSYLQAYSNIYKVNLARKKSNKVRKLVEIP